MRQMQLHLPMFKMEEKHMKLLPLQVDFDITMECMYKCKHCNVDAGEKLNYEMNTKEICDTLYQLYELGVSDISITGGEPLLRKDCIEILEYAYNLQGVKLTLNTNGLLLSDNLISYFETNLPNMTIAISLDGYDSNSYSNLRKWKTEPERVLDNEFNTVVNNLRKVAKSKLYCGVNYTVTKTTIANMLKTYDFIKNLGLNYMLMIKFFPFGQGKKFCKELELDYQSWNELLNEVTDLKLRKKEYYSGLQISTPCPWEVYLPLLPNYSKEQIHEIWNFYSPLEAELYSRQRDVGCHAGITSCAISPNGDVYPCGTISSNYPDFVCGNVLKQSVEDIFENSTFLNELRKIKLCNLKSECMSCDYKSLCGGGCRARAYTKYKDILAPDYLCPICKGKEE